MEMFEYGSVDQEDRNELAANKSSKAIALLYAWGKNQDGELSIGPNIVKNALEPTPLKKGVGYAKQIASAYSHSCLVNTEGKLYVTGSLLHQKLGLDLEHTIISRFTLQKHLADNRVKQVACGTYHTIALLENGQLFAWGGTLYNKTGQTSGKVCQVHVLASQKIVDIACGEFHNLVLNDKGEVFSWGGGKKNNKGQLGHGNFKDVHHPEQIKALAGKRVRRVHSGDYHCMVITDNDEVYSWGEGDHGQLGVDSKDNCSTPKRLTITYPQSLILEEYFISDSVKQATKISQIALGGKHSLLLTNKGHLFVCGYGSQGQLGLGKNQNVFQPTLVSSLVGKRVLMIAAGSNHSLALTDKFNVYACGYNLKGQLGLGDQKSRTIWTHINKLAGKKITRIYAGGNHSWAVLDEHYPVIQDYQPPSPIIMSQPGGDDSRSGEIPKVDTKSVASNMTLFEQMQQLSSNKCTLEVVYTDVDKYHRFIRFCLREQSNLAKNKLEEYLNYCYNIDNESVKYHAIRHDTDLFDEKGNLISHGDRRNVTLMMICDLEHISVKELCKPDQKSNISLGELYIFKESQLKSEGKILGHHLWLFKFSEMFEGMIERSRMFEFRPNK